MDKKSGRASLMGLIVLAAPVIMLSQAPGAKNTLIINGQSTDVSVIQVKGHPYAALETLTTALNGSLSSSGNVFALTFSNVSPANSATPAGTTAPPAEKPTQAAQNPGFSKQFLDAGIEEMSTLREWHAALASAIQNGIPLTTALLAPYRQQAAMNLGLAKVAALTDSDKSAVQLLSNEFQNMGKLSDKYLNQRANLDYIAPDALGNDDLNQRIIACGRSLRSMAANGQFFDDGSCD
jgi:hypothetical protein